LRIFKILRVEDWNLAKHNGVYRGSAVDISDGFIHFSAVNQVRETAARHFAGQNGLVLVGYESDSLGAELIWELSRNGQMFPHLYGLLDPKLANSEHLLHWDGESHVFPTDFSA
jgi:uncharacterized protein (DUF952 family)